MKFEEGRSKTGGRKKGTPNKETKKIRTWIGNFLDGHIHLIEDDIKALTPKDRIIAITNLMEYSVPKLQRTELVGDEQQGFKIIVDYGQADKTSKEDS